MTRHERTAYFERIVELRAAYGSRSRDDRSAVISIAEAIEHAEHELSAACASAAQSVPDDTRPRA